MIFYFSATGNSKYVAECIRAEGEKLISIVDAVDNNEYIYHVSDERVGVVSPTHDWTLPSIVSEFLEKLTLNFDRKPYLYYVATYGTTSGASASMAYRILMEKGLSFDACFDIKMPDTWTPVFDLSNPIKVQNILKKSDGEIKELKNQIQSKVRGKHMGLTTPYFTGKIGLAMYNRYTRNTANLSVTADCVGCGMCAKKCPAHAIEMENGRPVWVKDKCVMCLGCLHRCPKFAIQYGSGQTKRHGQYRNPHTKI
jgi:formate hydrogenlyase subunit 6/NADH:ubiquinone oxidoreductase subunit I